METNDKLSFLPVNLLLNKAACISFREDSFVVSFGDSSQFHEADGKGSERYLEWLKSKLDRDPKSVVHVWKGNEIIGQIEMGTFPERPKTGYVNLYYLIPAMRGQGLGIHLDNHSISYFKCLGFSSALLSVSPNNSQAMLFYKKLNWLDLGPSPKFPEVNFMEKKF